MNIPNNFGINFSRFEKPDINKQYYLFRLYGKHNFVSESNKVFSSEDYLRDYYQVIFNLFVKLSEISKDIECNIKNQYEVQYYHKKLDIHNCLMKRYFNAINFPMYLLAYNSNVSDGNTAFEYYTKTRISVTPESSLNISKINSGRLETYLKELNETKIKNIKSFMYGIKYYDNPELLEKILLQNDLKNFRISEGNIIYLYSV